MHFEEIMAMVCQGKTRQEMAKTLNLSVSAIDKRLKKLFLKYQVKKNSELVAKIILDKIV